MPVLNEASVLEHSLLKLLREQHFGEVLLVDGGSTDSTLEIIEKFIDIHPDRGFKLVHSPAGRAQQMNAGALVATSSVLLFLHADSHLPEQSATAIDTAIKQHSWGFFRIRLDSQRPLLWLVGTLMCWRSALTAIATGDQALFIKAHLFRQLGGFATIPLMEDIEFCSRLKEHGPPGRIPAPVLTSARRWQQYGIVHTILLMWSLRFAYWRGVAPEKLYARYVNAR